MLFNSLHYLFFFLPIVVFLYFIFLKINSSFGKIFLILASLYFYGSYNFYYLLLIIFSVIANFCLANILSKYPNKNFLILGILINIFLLSFFKYSDFVIENFNELLTSEIEYLNFPFPLAISFFTFQQIGFLFDIYDKNLKKISFKDYFLFICFFPQLVAGPIVRVNFFLNQFLNKNIYKLNFKNLNIGIILISIGLFKKIVVSDSLANIANLGFSNPENLTSLETLICSYAFTIQFYFDFSAYVDIALGSALLLNIKLPLNFNSPFRATSIINFWERWHITLTNFLTNFIYMPLARSFKEVTFLKSMFSILVVFIIAGIWHGPSWMFVIFGMMHGIGLIINHSFRKLFKIKLNIFVSWFITFNYINISFIFFRSSNLDVALLFLKNIFLNPFLIKFTGFTSENILNLGTLNSLLLVCSFIFSIFFKNSNFFLKNFKPNFFNMFLTLTFLFLPILIINKANEFIYFNF